MKIQVSYHGWTQGISFSKDFPTIEEAAEGLKQILSVRTFFELAEVKINDKIVPLSKSEPMTITLEDYL